ncbi:MAG: type II toxin-antitoxin system RelE/ParE family toxin [Chitinophagales bacterium]|nr:type II toxin-antitoxin system RelE/ParE family toxin [Chitinophagales bacterium]
MEIKFEVEFLPEAIEFLETVDTKARDKIYYNIKKSQSINDNELLKKLNEFIWEFRTLYNGKAYRLFAFWDKTDTNNTLVITTHGILKKTQKTPIREIQKAENIRGEYLEYKLKNKSYGQK